MAFANAFFAVCREVRVDVHSVDFIGAHGRPLRTYRREAVRQWPARCSSVRRR
jgi:hypothetical protein